MFRHTYCSARLQTLDQGAPVSVYTVGRELGHGGETLVKRVYGHLGQVRHRSEVVEYRVEQHAEILKDRLGALAVVPGPSALLSRILHRLWLSPAARAAPLLRLERAQAATLLVERSASDRLDLELIDMHAHGSVRVDVELGDEQEMCEPAVRQLDRAGRMESEQHAGRPGQYHDRGVAPPARYDVGRGGTDKVAGALHKVLVKCHGLLTGSNECVGYLSRCGYNLDPRPSELARAAAFGGLAGRYPGRRPDGRAYR